MAPHAVGDAGQHGYGRRDAGTLFGRKPGVDKRSGFAGVVDEEKLIVVVILGLPVLRELLVFISEKVGERDQITVVLVLVERIPISSYTGYDVV